MALTSLDVDDPVLLMVNHFKEFFSEVPVEVVTGFSRGGYEGIMPKIIPVEGEVREGHFRPRKSKTNLQNITAKAEVLVYEASNTHEEKTLDEKFGKDRTRISVDIYHVESRIRARLLYNEIRRIIMKVKNSPGGGYSFIRWLGRQDLTNRREGFWRYVMDIELVIASEYLGHA